MKRNLKFIVLAISGVIIIAAIYGYKEYNRKPADLSELQSQSGISADSLVMLFDKDEQKGNLLYLGKPIEVSGAIAEIINQKDTLVNITFSTKDDMHRVSCLIDANHINETRSYKVGNQIVIRGICNGYLLDVELNRCVIVK